MKTTSSAKGYVLLAENDDIFGNILKRSLEKESFDVYHALDGDEAWKLFNERSFDICLLDIMMEGLDGLTLGREIRRINKDVPVIYISSRYMEADRLEAFSTGADDYMPKPFSVPELVYRMNVHLRRSKRPQTIGTVHKIRDYSLDLELLTLSKDGTVINLTSQEVKILLLLVKNAGQIVSREDILKKAWGREDFFSGRSLDVFISRLRKHFKDDPHVLFESVRNKGYRLQIVDGIK